MSGDSGICPQCCEFVDCELSRIPHMPSTEDHYRIAMETSLPGPYMPSGARTIAQIWSVGELLWTPGADNFPPPDGVT
jgi:hypothetical protein